jgi:hypothetical protein
MLGATMHWSHESESDRDVLALDRAEDDAAAMRSCRPVVRIGFAFPLLGLRLANLPCCAGQHKEPSRRAQQGGAVGKKEGAYFIEAE